MGEKEFFKAYEQRPEKDKSEENDFTINDSEPLPRHSIPPTPLLKSDDFKDESASVDYSAFTVAELKDMCREKGLKVSARKKSELIERIEAHTENEKSQLKNTDIDLEPEKYLEMLVLEYLHASGGKASSRDVGRYMAVNKASYERCLKGQHISALSEMKECYGSLNSFVRRFSYLYTTRAQDHEFYICINEDSVHYKAPYVEDTMMRK